MQSAARKQLELALLATLGYFEVLGLALSPFELWRYLINPNRFGAIHVPPSACNLEVIYKLIAELEARQLLQIRAGFVSLPSTLKQEHERLVFLKCRDEKLKKAHLIAKSLRGIPFLRAVFLSGSVALGNTRAGSDLDLLIVAKAGRIWLVRTLVTLTLVLSRRRRHANLTRDRACLNHYITDADLSIPYPSLYNALTYSHLVPLFLAANQNYLGEFYGANSWLKDYLAQVPSGRILPGQVASAKKRQFSRRTSEKLLDGWVGNILEYLVRHFQWRRIQKDPRTRAPGGRVIATDRALEFHPQSQETKILAAYNLRLKKLEPKLSPEQNSGLL